MFFILAFLFLARRYGTSAEPVAPSFADPLAYDAPIFQRDECFKDCSCPGRSVWDIVWSCLATTFAVTWVSVHPNVPFLEESSWSLLKRRIFLMSLALLAPEVMIMWAFKQWRGAVMIRESINKARPKSCMPWTMTHAHFLQMRGFKVNGTEGNDFESWYYRLYVSKKEGIIVQECVINFDDLQYLLEEQLVDFPDTTAKEIEDRSKGDALSKGVALLQITWFIIQLIARAYQHLTIMEIELTTAALAGLNSIMYLFWWSKPLDVRCPIVIRTKELEKLLEEARIARHDQNEMRSEGGSGEDAGSESWKFTEGDFRPRDYLRESAQAMLSGLATHLRHFSMLLKTIRVLRCLLPRRTETDDEEGELLHERRQRLHFRQVINTIWTTWMLVVKKLFYLPYLLMLLPTEQILDPGFFAFRLEHFCDAKDKMHNKPALELLFNGTDMQWIMYMMFYSEDAETRPLLIFSALAGAAFGSIHCAAWHFEFPSPVERILWRTASLSIVGLCLLIVAVAPLYTRFVYHKWGSSYGETSSFRYWTRIKKTVETPPAIIYPVARLSLLILALLSLRRLPPSAFDTVVWTKFIPHI